MTTPARITEALSKLDIGNDNHWTADGLPRLDTMKLLVADQALTREAIAAAAPGFTRASAYAAQQRDPSQTPSPAAIAQPAQPAAVAAPVTGDDAADDADAGKSNDAPLPPPDFSGDEELAAAQAKLEELRKAKHEADAAYKTQSDLVDKLIVAREKVVAPLSSTPNAIQQYLASQVAKGQARGTQIAKARAFEAETGVKLADLVPKKAPIDVAMSRKNARGAARPTKL